ncbi:hypothetical protein EYF80_007490 [Liparis tanakae]|uniref:Uncharacterized protein n=1 Tax=Liparis tanakae TaxID=230148 RepID=A0A4Z2IWK3_9TELE|nr:hypothetical protein EYF80_007490 [Liparis tanakae]
MEIGYQPSTQIMVDRHEGKDRHTREGGEQRTTREKEPKETVAVLTGSASSLLVSLDQSLGDAYYATDRTFFSSLCWEPEYFAEMDFISPPKAEAHSFTLQTAHRDKQ